jgi:hypothetical protein
MTETWRASWLAGVATSTTSVAVVYAVMLEFALNVTSYGKTLRARGQVFAADMVRSRGGSLVSLPALVAAPWALWRSCSARC